MKTLSVAMTTFAGERFVEDQLKSLTEQSRLPDELVICDDRSEDGTMSIVESFARSAPFPVVIHRNDRNLGFADNFFKAAGMCRSEWIAFCDQDDVWLANRLSDAAEAIEKDPRPDLILQNGLLWQEGQQPGRRFPDRLRVGYHRARSLPGFWVWPGCMQTVRREFFTRLDPSLRPGNYFPGHATQSHDKWTCMLANALGGVTVLEEPALLFRRHGQNATGDYASKTIRQKVAQARTVDAEHYQFLASIAQEHRVSLERYAQSCKDRPDWADSLLETAARYDELAKTYGNRAALYSARGVARRSRILAGMVVRGDYSGARFRRLGARSLAKDAIEVLR